MVAFMVEPPVWKGWGVSFACFENGTSPFSMKQMPSFFLFPAARYATIWYERIFLSVKTYNEEFENVNPEYAAIRLIEQFFKRCGVK